MNHKKNDSQESNVLLFYGSNLDIGYIARTNTLGKEFDMVTRYIDDLKHKYSKFKTKKAAIFVEPQIDTGYPDIVVVEYYTLPQGNWVSTRESLNSVDYKILFYIQTKKYLSVDQICETLGYSRDTTLGALSKLEECSLIHLSSSNKFVRNVELKSYCRINKIIAIEAKINKWAEAIRQANNNIWFSTESYIMMNKESCSLSILETCKRLGIGIILINGEIKTLLRSEQRQLPVSYASLQFNEWLLRYINREGGKNDS